MSLIGYFVCISFVCFPGCSDVPTVTTAQNDPASVDSVSSIKPIAEPVVKVIGRFTNVEGDGEHETGYSVKLWSQEDRIYGLISGSSRLRLVGDPPVGLLENVTFDPKTKELSFRAKLTLGLFFDKNHSDEPSRDVYQFNGRLTEQQLKGIVLITNELCDDRCPKKEKITLRYSKADSSVMREYQTFAEWEAHANVILQRLGPEW